MIEAPHYSSAGAKRGTNFALPADANTIIDNVCLTAVGVACPAVEDTTSRIRR